MIRIVVVILVVVNGIVLRGEIIVVFMILIRRVVVSLIMSGMFNWIIGINLVCIVVGLVCDWKGMDVFLGESFSNVVVYWRFKFWKFNR